MTQEKKVEMMESEKALKVIRELVSKNKDLKLVEGEAKTGFSYFAGKKRLCKILKSKKGIRLEINVPLSKKLSEIPGMETISIAMAHKKHLGTMKHLYRAGDAREVSKIMTEALEVFAKELKQDQEQQAKEA